ncbi:MAG: stage II sporulation protein M [Paenibacillus sp.]|nr:stage II sporulation protein M [Paenibacillus sp.]
MKIQLKHNYYNYFVILCLIYIIALLIGLSFGIEEFNTIGTINNFDIDIPELEISNSHDAFFSILKHNFIVSIKSLLLGLLSFGVLPLVLSFYNGFIFGNIIGSSSHILTSEDILWATLPHSFEFIGMNLFGVVGFYFCSEYVENNRFPKIKKILSMIFVATIIIVLAALFESYISIRFN